MSHLSSETPQAKVPAQILCLVIGYSFFHSFNPFLSYTVPYLVQIKGLTNFQVTNKLLPISSYAMLVVTLLTAPACEHVSYKTLIIAGNFAALIGKLIMRFGTTLLSLQIMQIVGACSGVSYIVYQAYLFVLVTENHFQTMTSISLASASAATFVSAEIGQLMVLIGSSLNNILYVTIASASLACIIAFLIPKKEIVKDERPHFVINFFARDQGFWSIIKDTWANVHLQLLSFWWAFGLAGFELTLNYGTTLFEAIDSASTYNGQVIAIGTALAVLSALSSVYLREPVAKLGGFLYIFGSLTYGALILGMAYNRTRWLTYFLYIIMLGVERLLICFVYAQCGSLIKNDRYALLFSFNWGLSQAAQAVVQALLEIAGVDIFTHYRVMAIYFFGLAFVFGIMYGLYIWKAKKVVIVSQEDDEAPKLVTVDPLHQPLMGKDSAAI